MMRSNLWLETLDAFFGAPFQMYAASKRVPCGFKPRDTNLLIELKESLLK